MEINASPPQYIMVILLKVNPCSSGMSTQLFDVLKVNPCSSGMSTQLFDVCFCFFRREETERARYVKKV